MMFQSVESEKAVNSVFKNLEGVNMGGGVTFFQVHVGTKMTTSISHEVPEAENLIVIINNQATCYKKY